MHRFLIIILILLQTSCKESDKAPLPEIQQNPEILTINVTMGETLKQLYHKDPALMNVSLQINSNSQQYMTLTEDGTTLSISGLPYAKHDISIMFTYLLPDTRLSLAIFQTKYLFSDSSRTLTISTEDFDNIRYDEDNDGFSNLEELLMGSNPVGSNILVTSPSNFSVTNTALIITQFNAYAPKPELPISFSIIGGKDQDKFSLDSTTGDFSFISPQPLNVALAENIYNVSIQISDGEQSVDLDITVTVTDLFGVKISSQFRVLVFNWQVIKDADSYTIWKKSPFSSEFTLMQSGLTLTNYSHPISVHLFDRNTLFKIEAYDLNANMISSSMEFRTTDKLLNAIGMLKDSPPTSYSNFGSVLSSSADGKILAIGMPQENTRPLTSNDVIQCGESIHYCEVGRVSVYVFQDSTWLQQVKLMPIVTDDFANFGSAVGLSNDGKTLAVSVPGFDIAYPNINSDNLSDCHKNLVDQQNCSTNSGAVFVYQYGAASWQLTAILKADNAEAGDKFGTTMAISGDGNTITVGAPFEDSAAKNINGNPVDDCEVTNVASVNCVKDSGAAYIFRRSSNNTWIQQAYIKASNPATALYVQAEPGTRFAYDSISINGDGNVLVISAVHENSPSNTINGSQTDDCVFPPNGLEQNCAQFSGAVYVYRFVNDTWLPPTYIKSINTTSGQQFGEFTSISDDGLLLAVGTSNEGSGSIGINSDPYYDCSSLVITERINCERDAGAVYIYRFTGTEWQHFEYIKPTSNNRNGKFGVVSLSRDGKSLAVGAWLSPSCNEDYSLGSNDCLMHTGAVYLYHHDGVQWSPSPVFITAADPDMDDAFGLGIAQSFDGSSLIISAPEEQSIASGFNDQTTGIRDINIRPGSGAVYIY